MCYPNVGPCSVKEESKGSTTQYLGIYDNATNEPDKHYFDKLRGKWKVFQLADFEYLRAPGSEWYKETTELNGEKLVEFDGFMRVEVDSEVLYKAKTRIETFSDLTKDCKGGLGTC